VASRIIRKTKWRHSNLWSQYDLYVVGQRGIKYVKLDLSGEDCVALCE